MIGIVAGEICSLKGVIAGEIKVDVDQAGLYPATAGLATIDGQNLRQMVHDGVDTKVGVDVDKSTLSKTPMRWRSWALYPTKDCKVYYQILGNLHPVNFLRAFNLDEHAAETKDEAYEKIRAEVTKYSAPELEQKCMEHGFCGQTCFSPQHWRETLMGKMLARHPIVNYERVSDTLDLPPVPFPEISEGDKRPLGWNQSHRACSRHCWACYGSCTGFAWSRSN